MDRRGFIRLAVAGSAVGIIAPQSVLASTPGMTGAGGLFYTKDAPGRWSKKVGGHLPTAEVSKGADGLSLEVITAHEMRGYEHYIVKHSILDQEFNFIAENSFDPMKDKAPISTFSIGQRSGRIHILSMCNKHDVWLNFIDV